MLTFSESRGCAESSNDQQLGFVLGAATKLNGKVAGASNIFTGLGRSKGSK